MKTTAYIIRNGEVIAETKTELKNGASVKYAFEKCEEALNANREFNLVNARTAKISRNKKWANKTQDFANEINSGEFFI